MKYELHLAKDNGRGGLDWQKVATVEAPTHQQAAKKLEMKIGEPAELDSFFLELTHEQKKSGYTKAMLVKVG